MTKTVKKIVSISAALVLGLLSFISYMYLTKDNYIKCNMIVPTISVLDKKSVNGKTYYLVRKITGSHDKLDELVLYDKNPNFDSCAQSKIVSVYSEIVYDTESDDNLVVSNVYLNSKKNELDIKFFPKGKGVHNLNNLKLELRK
ncbi:hypothetical protein [Motiliproteus sp. MSK22-1]|uniref:hypothetical protein n=1 Tax=Motiliproteus sp. MSK22-1 TaxID=1897630 RepID=UPI000977D96B|nr:hypothetical protein [Motiliproteus sp. MSK22-1]OMH28467.1 hypothetical protein BGP75_21475 [Motiliproteus sp. MSK22-1]